MWQTQNRNHDVAENTFPFPPNHIQRLARPPRSLDSRDRKEDPEDRFRVDKPQFLRGNVRAGADSFVSQVLHGSWIMQTTYYPFRKYLVNHHLTLPRKNPRCGGLFQGGKERWCPRCPVKPRGKRPRTMIIIIIMIKITIIIIMAVEKVEASGGGSWRRWRRRRHEES